MTNLNLLYRAFILAALLSLYSVSGFSKQYTWLGTTSISWRTTTNWSPNGIPGSTDTVIIVSQVNNPSLSQNETVGKFTMTSGSLVLLTYTLTINGAAKFDGGTISGTATKAIKPRGSRATFDGTTLNAEVDAICGDIVLSGSVFNYPTRFEQTGTSTGNGAGGNTFNSTAYFKNGGSAYFLLATTYGNTFKDTTTFYVSGLQEIVASKAKSYFEGPIIVNSTNGGVNFGATDGDTCFFKSGVAIKIGSGGFSAGTLVLINVYQTDSTPQSFTLTGTSVLNISYSKFKGTFNATAPSTILKYNTFNDSLTLTKTGSTSALCAGGNIFNGVTLIKNHSSAQWRFANEFGDTFNNKVTFYTDSTGLLRPFYIGTSTVSNDLISSGSKIEYAASTGTVVFSGTANQLVHGTKALDFYRIRIDKSVGYISIDTTTSIADSLNLVKGNLKTTANHLLTLKAGSKASGNSHSFIDGPIKKIGNSAFTFPIGKEYSYAPAKITAPSSSTDAFTAEYFYNQQQHGSNSDTTLGQFSKCSYWNISRTTGSSNPYISLGWDSAGCGLSDTTDLKVANWNGTSWKDKGDSLKTGNAFSGFVSTATNSLTYGDFTWAYRKVSNIVLTPQFYNATSYPEFNHILAPDLCGYNGANTLDDGTTWYQLMNDGPPPALFDKHCTTLRIPAGTVANYFDWRSGWMIEEKHLPNNWHYIEGFLDKDVFTVSGCALPNEMAELKANSDLIFAKPMHCLNMLTSGYYYQLASLFRAKMLNLSTDYVELGNEYYLNNEQYKQQFPSVIDYEKSASQWCSDLKTFSDFNCKIAVVGATAPNGVPGRRKLWLKNLMNNISSVTGVDAVVLHQYIGSGLGGKVFKANMQTMLGTPFTSWDNQLKGEIELIDLYPISNGGTTSPEIWITEYNLRDIDHHNIGTWCHALFVASMTLQYLESPKVTKIVSHTMNGAANFGNIFSSDTGYDDLNEDMLPDGISSTTSTDKWAFTAMGAALDQIYQATKNCDNAKRLDFGTSIPDISTTIAKPCLYGWYFTGSDGDNVVIINLDSRLTFEINFMNIFGFGFGVDLEYEIINSLDDTKGLIGNPTTTAILGHPLTTGIVQCIACADISIPPHSILRVKKRTSSVTIKTQLTSLCSGTSTTFEIVGGVPPYSIITSSSLLTSLNTNNSIYQFNAPASHGSVPVTFPFTVEDVNHTTATVTFTVHNSGSVDVTSNALTFCPGATAITLAASITESEGAHTPYKYIWVPDSGVTDISSLTTSTIDVTPERTTTYQVYTYDNQCWSRSDEITITVPVAEVNLGEDLQICNPQAVYLYCNAEISGSGTLVYDWYQGSTSLGINANNYTTPSLSANTVYSVNVTKNGCTLSDEISILVAQCCTCSTGTCLHLSPLLDVDDNKVSYFSTVGNLKDAAILPQNLSYFTVTYLNGLPTNPMIGLIGLSSSHPIEINGEFRITSGRTINFKDCTFQFGEDAKIAIEGGCNITFDNCTFNTCGSNMWDGIIVDQKDKFNEPTITITGCTLNGAKNAVCLRQNAIYKIDNTAFEENYIDLKFENYLKTVDPNANYIDNCDFTSGGSLLISPYSSVHKLTCIGIKDAENIPIGSNSVGALSNLFENANFGIHAINAGLTLYNNQFENITNLDALTAPYDDEGTPLFVMNEAVLAGLNIIVGENSTYGSNNFTDCTKGILVDGEANSYIKKNFFNSILTDRSLEIRNVNNCEIQINDGNDFVDYSVGVHIHDMYGPRNVDISDNIFHNAYFTSSGRYQGTAIAVMSYYNPQTFSEITPYVTINRNIIGQNAGSIHEQARIGIIASGIFQPQIGNNEIYFNLTSSPAYNFTGIALMNCLHPRLSANTIQNDTYVAGLNTQLIGINSILNLKPCISNNSLNNLGDGLSFTGEQGYAAMSLNSFSNYDIGVNLVNAGIGVQGTTDRPDDNTWYNPTAASVFDDLRVNGTTFSGGPITWYYNNATTTGDIYNPNVNGAQEVDNIPITKRDDPINCPEFDSPVQRNLTFGRVVADSSRYLEEFTEEFSYLGKIALYKTLKLNPELLDLSDAADESFQEFNDVMRLSNFAKYDTLESYIDRAKFSEALEYLLTITDTNVLEGYLNEVYGIYINYKSNHESILEADSNRLIEIANMDVLTSGEATLLARSILFLEIVDNELSGSRIGKSVETSDKEVLLEVFPNPVKHNLFLKVGSIEGVEIKIFDPSNKLLKQQHYNSNVDVSYLAAGVYYLDLIESNGTNHYARFIKIK